MEKSFTCSDVGVNCNWSASAENNEDLLNKIKEHAKNFHKLGTSFQNYEKVKNAIK